MKKNFLLVMGAAAMLFMASCGSSKTAPANVGMRDVETPCSGVDYSSDDEYLRESAMSISTSQSTAKKKAMSTARAALANALEVKVKTVTDDFVSSYESGVDEESKRRFAEMTRSAANQTLNGIRTICEKTQQAPDGKYHVYVAIELSGKTYLEQVASSISSDEKLRIDYEYEKFKDLFEKEMSDLEKSK